MIKIKAIQDNEGNLIPETYCVSKYGSHCDGFYFYFYQSDEEREEHQPKAPEIVEQQNNIGAALTAIENATDEEKQQIADILKPFLKQ